MKRGRVGSSVLSSVCVGILGGACLAGAGCGRLEFGEGERIAEPATLKLAYPHPGSFHAVVNVTRLELPPAAYQGIEELRFSPELPAGLSVDVATGVISGVPTASVDRQRYEVTGVGADKTTVTTTLHLTTLPGWEVDSQLGNPDTNPGDGICQTSAPDGKCTLRGAIDSANAAPAGKWLVLVPPGEVSVDGEIKPIVNDVVIAGSAFGKTVVEPLMKPAGHRFMSLDGNGNVRLENAAFRSFGPVDGGLLRVTSSTLEAFEVEMANNQSTDLGGALYFDSGAKAHLERVTFLNNTAPNRGGAIYAADAGTKVVVVKSAGIENGAGYGGFAHFEGAGPVLHLINSTLVGNRTSISGTVASKGGHLEIQSSTIAHNVNDADPLGYGSGGIYLFEPPASLSISNSIVALNTSANGICNCRRIDLNAVIESKGGNLFSDAADDCATGFTGKGDAMSTDPLLASTAAVDNGGHIRTVALRPGSAAIGLGAGAQCPPDDQRGVTRHKSDAGTCDAGAFELEIP